MDLDELLVRKTRYADELPENASEGYSAIDTKEQQTLVYKGGKWIRIPKPPVPELQV
jgi:hypothetical protein